MATIDKALGNAADKVIGNAGAVVDTVGSASDSAADNSAVDTAVIIIVGATGDLAKRKLIPALLRLYALDKISCPILCIGRRQLSDKDFVDILEIKKNVSSESKDISGKLASFLNNLHYIPVDFSGNTTDWTELKRKIRELDSKHNCNGNRLFYLATPPNMFETFSEMAKASGILTGKGWKRIVFEKPFGYDLKSAKQLNAHVASIFKEEDIYRIDHYLGKELVQNIIVLRFANTIFEQIWNSRFIDHVQITAAEAIGIESRGEYYDSTGAIRDMLQSHMLQVLSFVAMECPKSMDADSIRDEKVRVFRKLKMPKPNDVVIGQYGKGIIDGNEVRAYVEEKNVAPDSKTETFAAVKLYVKSRRWKNVPFYLRTAKRYKRRYAEVNLVLKDVETRLFQSSAIVLPNVISIRIQPDEGIAIRFNYKQPGQKMHLSPVVMDFCHHCEFGMNTPEAYETLLHEIMLGDQTLFTRWDGLEETWTFTDKLMKIVKKKYKSPPIYPAGSKGPDESQDMIIKDSRKWIYFERKAKH